MASPRQLRKASKVLADFARRLRSGHVYLLEAGTGGPVKIGHTRMLKERMEKLQTGNPVELKLIGFFYGGAREERALHARYAAWRLRGEWFLIPAPELRDLVLEFSERRVSDEADEHAYLRMTREFRRELGLDPS